MNYREALNRACDKLVEKGVPDAKNDAWVLFEHVTGVTRNNYFMMPDAEMDAKIQDLYFDAVRKRCERIPLQYITGEQSFYGFTFEVSHDTLIPRQDTEVLVEEVIKHAKGKEILDLCTGTGCILISIAGSVEVSAAVGTDISVGAVELARRNAEKNGIKADFFVGDLFNALDGTGYRAFDIIVSNPPYIRSKEIEKLMPEVKDHEPMTALDGDTDGLLFYRRIIKDSGVHLKKGGMLFFEIGYDQAGAVSELMQENGYADICTIKDYGQNDRVVYGIKEKEEKYV